MQDTFQDYKPKEKIISLKKYLLLKILQSLEEPIKDNRSWETLRWTEDAETPATN
jgi:hypothetical protein